MKGKIIVIEGTDCSGKETQSNLLQKRLEEMGYKIYKSYYPLYESPTGKIVGGPYLGKKHICEGYFSEGASKVDPMVASLYYAADRRYNNPIIKEKLEDGYIVILDRYVSSNMGYQASKISDKDKSIKMIDFLETLEYDLLELPRPDITLFLYMPHDKSKILKNKRAEASDEHEVDEDMQKHAEDMYFYLAKRFNYMIVNCTKNNKIRTIEDISDEVFEKIFEKLEEKAS